MPKTKTLTLKEKARMYDRMVDKLSSFDVASLEHEAKSETNSFGGNWYPFAYGYTLQALRTVATYGNTQLANDKKPND